ncbi:MAG: class II fumarate hydratase [Thermoguttaceae bacterium]
MTTFRTECDSTGEIRLPAHAYYGPQTQRAVENFPISGRTLPPELIHALGLVKWAAASVNRDLGRFSLAEALVSALLAACREVAEGKLDDQFPVDVFQTGSGTSSNMNANEVIANRAVELAGGDRSREKGTGPICAKPGTSRRLVEGRSGKLDLSPFPAIHANDHVNLGQSTNDVFPTAIHVAAAVAIGHRLIPALERCGEVLAAKAAEWKDVLKIGRTHLADATPFSLGQEIGGLACQLERSVGRAAAAMEALFELPIGGTAIGTGINTHPDFGRLVCAVLADETGIPFVEAADHFEANAQRDGLVECHGQLRTIAATMFNVANNIRWLASGPRCGIHEIELPELQPGSSIMPGKVNPVLCESLMQAAARALGNDQTIVVCGAAGGQFQLNVMMPLMADATLESVRLLANATGAFTAMCLAGMKADAETCEAAVERSLAIATALNPYIGYERAAALAKEALATGKTIRELCVEKKVLPEEQLNEALDPWRMTRPRP